MIFLFDYIDNWEFELHLERIEPLDPQISQAVVLESKEGHNNRLLEFRGPE